MRNVARGPDGLFHDNRLREIRTSRGLTLEQLAALTGCSFQQVWRLESRQRVLTEQWRARLAVPLGVEPDDLLCVDDISEPEGVGDFGETSAKRSLVRIWDHLDAAGKADLLSYLTTLAHQALSRASRADHAAGPPTGRSSRK